MRKFSNLLSIRITWDPPLKRTEQRLDFYLFIEFLIPTQGGKPTLYHSLLTSHTDKSASLHLPTQKLFCVAPLSLPKHRAKHPPQLPFWYANMRNCVSLRVCQFPDSNLFIAQPSSHSVCFMSRILLNCPFLGTNHVESYTAHRSSVPVVLAVAAGLLWR
jgi:hypothetical protein